MANTDFAFTITCQALSSNSYLMGQVLSFPHSIDEETKAEQ